MAIHPVSGLDPSSVVVQQEIPRSHPGQRAGSSRSGRSFARTGRRWQLPCQTTGGRRRQCAACVFPAPGRTGQTSLELIIGWFPGPGCENADTAMTLGAASWSSPFWTGNRGSYSSRGTRRMNELTRGRRARCPVAPIGGDSSPCPRTKSAAPPQAVPRPVRGTRKGSRPWPGSHVLQSWRHGDGPLKGLSQVPDHWEPDGSR